MNIPITKTFFDECESRAVTEVLQSGWVVQGPKTAEFERRFAGFTQAAHAIATTSCTTALHLALLASGVRAGDKVVLPSFTYIATANAVEYCGATPIFCDVDLTTFNINTQQLESILKQHGDIAAILPVHLFGLCADMPHIMELADSYGCRVIEDAACAFGAWIGERHAGTFGDAGCFSFHPRKAISTGEGGMLITRNDTIAHQAGILRNHGAETTDLERHEKGGSLLPEFNHLGYNYRLTDIQAAIGLCQMDKAEMILQQRRKWAARYDAALLALGFLQPPHTPASYIHGYQSYVCLYTEGTDITRLDKPQIDALNQKRNTYMQRLEAAGIATRQGTHAVHTLGYYREKYALSDADYLQSYASDRLSIALPLYASMSEEEFMFVIESLRSLG